MIDIHNHTLYGVDDGSKSLEMSIQMLQIAKAQGVDAVILTPHYRRGYFRYPLDDIAAHFRILKGYAAKMGIGLAVGCEYYVDNEIYDNLKNSRIRSLGGSEYVLTEYAFETSAGFIKEFTQGLVSRGYRPVIAHVERYRIFQQEPELVAEFADQGALIQCNADAILGKEGWRFKRITQKMLKAGLVDIVASDTHRVNERANHLGECKDYVLKKFGSDYAERIFEQNPQRIWDACI